MQYKDYGKRGKRVSVLGYGAMRLPFGDHEESVALLRQGLDLGINYIDTAYGYGNKPGASERLVATKNPVGDGDTAESWWRNMETSLTRLDTDHIDFYKVVHGMSWDYYTRVYEKRLHQTALNARDQGLISHMVFSCHDRIGILNQLFFWPELYRWNGGI